MRYILNFLRKYCAFIISIIFVISLFLVYTFVGNSNEVVKAQELEIKEECNCENNIEEFLVDVKGAVKNPGVYKVSSDAIINDVIKLAGGLLKTATTDDINLSKKVSNEMIIYVSTKSELKAKSEVTTPSTQVSNTTSNSCVTTTSNKVNINTASKEELTTLNGVGESKALAIIEYRNTNGLFSSINDLMKVSGIGESAFEKIKDYITI